jgi:hypothetical protein
MVKIERLLNGGQGTVVRHGHTMPIYQNMVITLEELGTLNITYGSVTYSIDEEEVITREREIPHEPAPTFDSPKPVVAKKKIVVPDKLKANK